MANNDKLENIMSKEYQYGFKTDIESQATIKGLSEETIRKISKQKKEPDFLLNYRLKAYQHWKAMKKPVWAELNYPETDYQNIIYYAEPKSRNNKPKTIEEVDPELRKTFEKLGIPLIEQKRLTGVAVDAIFDSVSVATTYKEKLKEVGVIFCSFSEATQEYPELIERYLGTVVPYTDNYYAALNSAVFSDGSFVYIPKNTKCPMELSTYFRINTESSGQFERTLIVCEDNSYVSYLEGCTAPRFDENQLHAAVVELVAMNRSEIKYSTVQNWYSGDPKTGKGGIYNFVTKRGKCLGDYSKISWTQVETGSSITWKYPSCLLLGDHSIGEFYSVALTNHFQQADTGTKMIHRGKHTRSRVVSKGISAGNSSNNYRGLIDISNSSIGSKNHTQCDSLLIGSNSKANTYPYTDVRNANSELEHEASTSKINEEQLLYFRRRGMGQEEAVNAIINGFCKEVFNELPTEFAVEATQLLGLKLEGAVG